MLSNNNNINIVLQQLMYMTLRLINNLLCLILSHKNIAKYTYLFYKEKINKAVTTVQTIRASVT